MRNEEPKYPLNGYVRFVVHPKEDRGIILEMKENDDLWGEFIQDFVKEDANLTSYFNLYEIMGVNPDIRGCLVLATYYYTEIPNVKRICDVIVLCKNYREQWRKNLILKYEQSSDKEAKEIIEETKKWNTFYQENLPTKQYQMNVTIVSSRHH